MVAVLARCDGLTIFLPSPPRRKRVSDEFEVHVDRFVIVTAPLFAETFYSYLRSALFQARFWDSKARACEDHPRVMENRTEDGRTRHVGVTLTGIYTRYRCGLTRSRSLVPPFSSREAGSLLISTRKADRIRLVNSAGTHSLFPTRENYAVRLFVRAVRDRSSAVAIGQLHPRGNCTVKRQWH